MTSDDCFVGVRVRINWPDNPVLHGETGTVVERTASDEALVSFDRMKPEFSNYDDTRTGRVTVCPEQLEVVD